MGSNSLTSQATRIWVECGLLYTGSIVVLIGVCISQGAEQYTIVESVSPPPGPTNKNICAERIYFR